MRSSVRQLLPTRVLDDGGKIIFLDHQQMGPILPSHHWKKISGCYSHCLRWVSLGEILKEDINFYFNSSCKYFRELSLGVVIPWSLWKLRLRKLWQDLVCETISTSDLYRFWRRSTPQSMFSQLPVRELQDMRSSHSSLGFEACIYPHSYCTLFHETHRPTMNNSTSKNEKLQKNVVL